MGCFALYCAWAAFLYVLVNRDAPAHSAPPSLAQVYLSPFGIWRAALSINDSGWYSMFSGTPSGIILWIFWLAEAAIIVFCVAALPMTTLSKVFCENCESWCDEKEDIARFDTTGDKKLLERIQAGELNALAELRMSPSGSKMFLRVDSQRCKTCPETATFAVKKVTLERNKEGKMETKAEDVCAPVVLTPEALQQFQQALIKPPAGPA